MILKRLKIKINEIDSITIDVEDLIQWFIY